MSINIADNMGYNGKKPLDNRTQYSTLALMKTVTDATLLISLVLTELL